jgi:hypothetical protein
MLYNFESYEKYALLLSPEEHFSSDNTPKGGIIMKISKIVDKTLIGIGRKLYIILPCISIAVIVLLYIFTDTNKHFLIFVLSLISAILCYCLFQLASRVRPKKFSFTRLLNDRGVNAQLKDGSTLQVCKEGAIVAELSLEDSGIVNSIKSRNHDGSFTTKVAEIAPQHQPFYKAVEIAQRKLYFTPSMAFYITCLTLSLGRRNVQKEDMRKEISTYFSGVDFLYS